MFRILKMCCSIVGRIFVELFCVFSAVVVAGGVLCQAVLLSPIYAFRFCVKLLGRKFRPDLGEILTTGSGILALDDRHRKPMASVIFCFVFDGDLDLEALTAHILDKVVHARNPKGELCYPELKQYITSWLGFYFWAHDESFEVQNHVRLYSEGVGGGRAEVSELELSHLTSSWLSKPYHKTRSPWTFLLVPNLVSKGGSRQTALAFRCHHALADGFSIIKLVDKLWDGSGFRMPVKAAEPKESLFRSLMSGLSISVLTPYRAIKMGWDSVDRTDWHLNQISHEVEGALVPQIPISVLKEIQSHYNVSYLSAIIFAAYAGALRRMMLQRGYKVPGSVHSFKPAPVPGHPDNKLRNHASVTFVELPVGIPEPEARLKAIDANFKHLTKDPTPVVMFHLRPLTGGLFNWMLKPFLTSRFLISTVWASCLPGPKTQVQLLGLNCTDQHFTFGILAGIGMTTLTYNGNIRFWIAFDKILLAKMPNPDVQNIASMILEEVEVLRKGQVA